jgi:hypothetical protein
LQKIKSKHTNRAKELIPQLCYALANDDPLLSKEDNRDRIKRDSSSFILSIGSPIGNGAFLSTLYLLASSEKSIFKITFLLTSIIPDLGTSNL